ncbi:MAG TPA: hypothetical protein VNJ31_02910 [Methyloceanibacter sp.]|nr:hypothetical protein [Methyloceanibacter sp.]
MSRPTARASASRRNAEVLLGKAQKRETNFKLEQEREYEALARKTARLRELRLAKEAAENESEPKARPATRSPKARRSRQT